MKALRALLPLLLLAACTSATTVAPTTLRVMTYNIHAGKDAAGVDNLERVAELIRTQNADVVLLQEVDRGTTRSGNVDQLEVLTRLTGMHGAFGKSLDYQGGLYGIAILSRWAITKEETVHLQIVPPQQRAGGSYEPRVALFVETKTPRGSVAILNTHLDASRDDHYRLQEVEQVVAAAASHHVAFAGGDFNAEPQSAVHERVIKAGLHDAWTICPKGAELTFPANTPVKRIDYVFLTGRVDCSSASVVATEASDHRPVVVTMTLH